MKRIIPFLMLTMACTLWGSSFVIAKYAMKEMSSFDIAFWRSAMACIIFLPIIIKNGKKNISKKDLYSFLLIGALTVPVTYLLQFCALDYINAATAALLIGVEPISIAFMASLILGDKLKVKVIVAAFFGALGVYLVFADQAVIANWIGIVMVLLSTLVVGVWVALTKKSLKKFSTAVATAYVALFGFLSFLVVSPLIKFNVGAYSFRTWFSVFLLTFTSSVLGHLLWNGGLKRVDASKAGVFLVFEPTAGVFLATILLEEAITENLVFGLLLVIFAMLLATWPNKEKQHS